MASEGTALGVQHDPQQLTQVLNRLAAQLINIQDEQIRERETNREQIRILQENLASLREERSTPGPAMQLNNSPTEPLATAATPPAPTVKKKPTLPDPPRFNGIRRKFRTWELEMRSKLQIDGPAIGSPYDQFAYIYARLEEGPQAMAATFFQKGGYTGTHDPEQFLAYLSTCYGDPNLEQSALGRLERIYQKDKESFTNFLPRFERELADSGGAEWGEAVKINYLKRAINRELREGLVGQLNLPRDYHGFIKTLQSLSANIESLRLFPQRRSRDKSRSPPPNHRTTEPRTYPAARAAAADEMEWEPTKIGRAFQKASKELKGKRALWVEQTEVDRRRNEGRCLRCGKAGCWVDKCPLLPAKRPRPDGEVKARRARPALRTAVDDEDEGMDPTSPDQSENESLKD